MNNDFPRILSLLRKERHLSQKQVASDLGIAQALLSHYEKGKRECGLEFLVHAADYYSVSTDYLLGRSPVSSGTVITPEEIPESEQSEKVRDMSALSTMLNKKLISNSIDIIYSLLLKAKNQTITHSISEMLTLSVYRAFRLTYRINPKNDSNMFGIGENVAYRAIDAGISVSEGKTADAIACADTKELPQLTTASLEEDYQKQATALLNLIKNSEAQLKKYTD